MVKYVILFLRRWNIIYTQTHTHTYKKLLFQVSFKVVGHNSLARSKNADNSYGRLVVAIGIK